MMSCGHDWKNWYEKGNEVVVHERKKQLQQDQNQTVKVNSVYRQRVEDEDANTGKLIEIIKWNQTITCHTGLGNPVSYYEDVNDLCIWYAPTQTEEIKFNAETEQKETIVKPADFSMVKKHYLYPFNKENIDMIKKITSNNRKCNWYIEDENAKVRVVNNFDDWTKNPSTN